MIRNRIRIKIRIRNEIRIRIRIRIRTQIRIRIGIGIRNKIRIRIRIRIKIMIMRLRTDTHTDKVRHRVATQLKTCILNPYLKDGIGKKAPSIMSEVLFNIALLGLVMNIHRISSIIPSMSLLLFLMY